MARAATARRAWLLTTLAILLAVGALGAIVVALVLQQSAPDPEPGARSADQAAAPDAGGGDEANAISDRVDPAWVTVTAERLGIPERALAAYAGASLAVVEEYPDCGIGWNTVAAIGEVESIHGTIHGSRIGEDGVAEPAIIGIRLDGTSTQRIPTPTTACSTATRSSTGPWARCSSFPRRGGTSRATGRARASPTRRTSTTPR